MSDLFVLLSAKDLLQKSVVRDLFPAVRRGRDEFVCDELYKGIFFNGSWSNIVPNEGLLGESAISVFFLFMGMWVSLAGSAFIVHP